MPLSLRRQPDFAIHGAAAQHAAARDDACPPPIISRAADAAVVALFALLPRDAVWRRRRAAASASQALLSMLPIRAAARRRFYQFMHAMSPRRWLLPPVFHDLPRCCTMMPLPPFVAAAMPPHILPPHAPRRRAVYDYLPRCSPIAFDVARQPPRHVAFAAALRFSPFTPPPG